MATSGGCGSTPLQTGPAPAWLTEAASFSPPAQVRYVLGDPATAGGFLFVYPLRAGHPTNPSNNKILWAIRSPRNGSQLVIDAHPLGASAPVISNVAPANSGPGEIYPSILDVPFAGCWHITLRWRTGQTSVDLEYVGQ